MVAFGHTAVGTIVGVAGYEYFGQGNLIVGLIKTGLIGIVSHYVMDFIPHGHFFRGKGKFEKYIFWVIIFDLLLPILLILGSALYFQKNNTEILYVLFGIGGSQLPDIIDSLMRLKFLPKTGFLKLEKSFHQAMHWHGTEEKALIFSVYDIWQIAVFAIALIVLIKF